MASQRPSSAGGSAEPLNTTSWTTGAPALLAGHRRVRWLLVQAAVSILRVRHPGTAALRAWALGIAARRGRFIGVVFRYQPR